MDELERARRRHRVGDRVGATVTRVPSPGVVGIFLDLDSGLNGFVDVLHLPLRAQDWPPVGARLDCEVLQHRVGQLRLWPLEPRWRTERPDPWGTAADWKAVTRAHPVGSIATARVTAVYVANREYLVDLGDCSAGLDYRDTAPVVGDTGDYRVTAHLAATHRLLLAPVDSRRRETGATPRQDAATPE